MIRPHAASLMYVPLYVDVAMYRVELREQSLLLLDEKAGLRKTLKEFENSFVAKHGR